MDKNLTPEEFAALPKDQQDLYMKNAEAIITQQKKLNAENDNLKQISMKDFEASVKTVMEKLIKPMTEVDRKYFMFPGIGTAGADDRSAEGKFVKTRRFINALLGNDRKVLTELHNEVNTKANWSEGSNVSGGFLVPEEFSNEVLKLQPIYGVARANCRVITMRRDVISMPALGTTEQSAIWTNEGKQVMQTDPNLKQLQLVAHKLGAFPKVTSELLEDADVNVIQLLAEQVAWAFAKEEDNQAFLGIGAPFIGMLIGSGGPYRAFPGTIGMISYADLVKATGDLYSNVVSAAKWYIHRTVNSSIRSITTTAGAPVYDLLANNLVGYPITLAEKMRSLTDCAAVSGSCPFGIFGDLRVGYAFGERGGMAMKIFSEGTVGSDNLAEKDMSAIRVLERIAMGALLPSAYVQLGCTGG